MCFIWRSRGIIGESETDLFWALGSINAYVTFMVAFRRLLIFMPSELLMMCCPEASQNFIWNLFLPWYDDVWVRYFLMVVWLMTGSLGMDDDLVVSSVGYLCGVGSRDRWL